MTRQKVIRNFTQDEVERVLDSLGGRFGPRNRALVRIGIATGLRVSELLALNVADVRRAGRIVREEGCGVAVSELTCGTLAAALDELRQPPRLADCQARARQAGRQRYNWAQAERQLLGLYDAIGLPCPEGEAGTP